MQRFTAACVQMHPVPMDVDGNLRRARQLLGACREATGASLLVLPESFATGFTPIGTARDLWNAVDSIPGRLTQEGARWARELDAWIVFPTYERGSAPGTVYNSAALIGPDGLAGTYRKTHPWVSERLEGGGWTTPGTEPFCVQTPLGRIGIVVCYDGDFPELARATALMGAEVVCRPSAFARTFEHWDLTNRARAYDNHVYWVATNAVGEDAGGFHAFGASMIVHPTGTRLAMARGSEEFCWAQLDPDPLRTVLPGCSEPQRFDHLQDRNLAAYRDILRPGTSAFEPARRMPYSVPGSAQGSAAPAGRDHVR